MGRYLIALVHTLQKQLCRLARDMRRGQHRMTPSITAHLTGMLTKRVFIPTQLPRKPETKEVDVSYGKKVRDASSRGKAGKEEWKEREASANQAAPARIKIFEGGSVERRTIGILFIFGLTEHKSRACAPCLVKNIL